MRSHENYATEEIKPKSRVCDLRYLSISIANSMICSDIWHKYYEWFFEIVIPNLTSASLEEIHQASEVNIDLNVS